MQLTDNTLLPVQILDDINDQSASYCGPIAFEAHPVQRLLDHLKEAAFYSAKDLDSVNHTLDAMRDTLSRGKETYSPHLLTLLENRLDTCGNILADLKASLADLSPELTPIHEKLVSILRSISAANTRYKVNNL